MATAKKVLIHRWFEEVWNRKRREAIFEMLHPEAIIYGLADNPATPLKGPNAFIPFWEKFIDAFPDIQVSVESTMAEDDKVMARCSVRGHHTGHGLGIIPTKKAVAFTGICLCHVKDGMLYEGWNSFDFLTLYQQIGIIHLPRP
jgi:predicted ester cyclase